MGYLYPHTHRDTQMCILIEFLSSPMQRVYITGGVAVKRWTSHPGNTTTSPAQIHSGEDIQQQSAPLFPARVPTPEGLPLISLSLFRLGFFFLLHREAQYTRIDDFDPAPPLSVRALQWGLCGRLLKRGPAQGTYHRMWYEKWRGDRRRCG